MDELRATGALVAARFVARPNRFIVTADLEDGRRTRAWLADPGRLERLLVSHAELRLRPNPPSNNRKTAYTVALVRASAPPRAWVSVDTMLANRLVEPLLAAGRLHGLGSPWGVRREVRRGASRFDFVLTRGEDEVVVEVKSVTLVDNGIGRFPDAPTVRGSRHVRELRELVEQGDRAAVLFVVQRGDAHAVTPNPEIDPLFAHELRLARKSGVLLRAIRFHHTPSGRAVYRGPLPVRT